MIRVHLESFPKEKKCVMRGVDRVQPKQKLGNRQGWKQDKGRQIGSQKRHQEWGEGY
jgi:hypothetical protein